MATKKELEEKLHQYEHVFQNFQQNVTQELENRDAREFEMLKRIYPYLANELDSYRQREQQQGSN